MGRQPPAPRPAEIRGAHRCTRRFGAGRMYQGSLPEASVRLPQRGVCCLEITARAICEAAAAMEALWRLLAALHLGSWAAGSIQQLRRAGALGCALTPAAERAALVRRRGASGMVQAPCWCYESRSAWSDAEAVLEQPLSSPGAARAPPPDITLHRQRRPFAVSGHTVLPLRNKHRDYERCGKLVYETCQHRHSCCVQKSRQVCTRTVTTEERISLAAAAAVGESAVPHLITAGPQGGRRGDGCDEHTRLTLWCRIMSSVSTCPRLEHTGPLCATTPRKRPICRSAL